MHFHNSPKEFFGRTIYVSNHAASFMDPISIASLRMPIVFFMTRSDIFNSFTRPILYLCQMLPIYRQHDGEDTKKKNEAVFLKCTRILAHGRNLLIFGEGFTDDEFIRRLKPVKKGAVRIGFSTLEAVDWKKKIYMAGVGVNYSNPNRMRSDYVLSYSKKICLNDYRADYEANPNKTISDLTKRVEALMQEQITHVQQKEYTSLHEQIMMLTRRGMNADNFDRSISLKDRWRYSQKLANWMNTVSPETMNHLASFNEDSKAYFEELKHSALEEHQVHWKITHPSGNGLKEVFMLLFLFPFAILGFIHCAPSYLIVKRFVERSFQRKVFWGSVKLAAGKILMGLVNIPFIFIIYYAIYPSWLLAFTYYFAIGLFGLAAYLFVKYLRNFKSRGILHKRDLSEIISKRADLIKRLNTILPEEFQGF